MKRIRHAITIVLGCFFTVSLATCQLSCLETGAASSSLTRCCQCTQHPEWYHCFKRCQHNMYPVGHGVAQCAAQFLPTSTHHAGSGLHKPLLLQAGSLEGSTSAFDNTPNPEEANPRTDSPHETPPTAQPPATMTYTPAHNRTDKDRPHQLIMTCGPCDIACNGCTGAGPTRCLRCSAEYQVEGHSVDSDRTLAVICRKVSAASTKTDTSLDTLNIALMCLVSMLLVLTGLLLTRYRLRLRLIKQRVQKLEVHIMTTEGAHGAEALLPKAISSSVDPEVTLSGSTTAKTVYWDRNEDSYESVYEDIGNSCVCLEARPQEISTVQEKRQTSAIQIMEEARSLSHVTEKTSLLGQAGLLSPRTEKGLKEISTFTCLNSYCDYRMPGLRSPRFDQTNPKIPVPETVPLTIHVAAEVDGRDNKPPLPPRNKVLEAQENSWHEQEISTTKMPPVIQETTSPSSVAECNTECPEPTPSEHGTVQENTGKDYIVPKSQTPAEAITGMPDHQASEDPGLEDPLENAKGVETRSTPYENGGESLFPKDIPIPEGFEGDEKHPHLIQWKKSSNKEDTGSRLHRRPDSICSLSSVESIDVSFSVQEMYSSSHEEDEDSESNKRPFPENPCDGINREVLLYSCPSQKQKEGSLYSLRKTLSHDYTRSPPSSAYSSCGTNSEYMCFVSNFSTSSGYQSPQGRTLSLELSYPSSTGQTSWTLANLRSKHEEVEEAYVPFSPSGPQRLPGFGQLLPTQLLKKYESYVSFQREEKIGMLDTYFLSILKEISGPESKENCGPVFSTGWQKEQVVSQLGGVVHTDGSAVRLEVPPGAVATGESVTIKAAISTSLDQAYSKLFLPDDEYIASPIAEYFAGVDFNFRTPVKILLPHFLPRMYTPEQVNVYVFHREPNRELSLQKLKLRNKDNEKTEDTDVFGFAGSTHLEIFTTHFSGYLCTGCKSVGVAQELFLVLFARNMLKLDGGCDVDVRLEIWDSRLAVTDFDQACFQRVRMENERNMLCIDRQSLCPPEEDQDIQLLQIGCELDLLTEEQCQVWSHAVRRDGRLMQPVRKTIPLKTMAACNCPRLTIPKQVNWKLTKVPGSAAAAMNQFGALVDVGYVRSDQVLLDQRLNFLNDPQPVTIDITVAPFREEERTATGTPNSCTRAMEAAGRPPTMMGTPRSRQWPGNTQLQTLPKTAPSAGAAAPVPPGVPLQNPFPHLSLQDNQVTGRGEGFPEINRSGYVDFRSLQELLSRVRSAPQPSGIPSQPGTPAGDHDGSLPSSSSSWQNPPPVTYIEALNVNFGSSGESSIVDSSLPTSNQSPSMTSSATSSDFPMPAWGRQPRGHSTRMSGRDTRPLARNRPDQAGGSDSSELNYGYQVSDQSDYEMPISSHELSDENNHRIENSGPECDQSDREGTDLGQ